MKNSRDLRFILEKIDHRGYPAYRDTVGNYQFDGYILHITHVQSDPFASPSDVAVSLKNAFPEILYDTAWKKRALEDFLLRQFASGLKGLDKAGSGKSGKAKITRPGPHILKRSACTVDDEYIAVRFHIGFPAHGRKIDTAPLIQILYDRLPKLVLSCLDYARYDQSQKLAVKRAIDLADDQHFIRTVLKERNLAAFVADGSILPRSAGNSMLPMEGAVPFQSPDSLKIELELPHKGKITGMGIPKGITLIVGGGYHGKSTLLQALQDGVYDHAAGDGREYVITDDTAVKIRAEDGRAVTGTNITAFISNLPHNIDTKKFTTRDASGSTSQAANVMEALEAQSRLLLLDEDTSATNFMVRDSLMQQIIHPDQEPIIPFIERLDDLRAKDISVILVAGSSGSFFDQADLVLQMDQYQASDITYAAKKALHEHKNRYPGAIEILQRPQADFSSVHKILPAENCLQPKVKVKSRGLDTIAINHEDLDVRYLEQLIDNEQLAFIGAAIKYLSLYVLPSIPQLDKAVDALLVRIEEDGLAILGKKDMSQARKQEIMAAILRLRTLKTRN